MKKYFKLIKYFLIFVSISNLYSQSITNYSIFQKTITSPEASKAININNSNVDLSTGGISVSIPIFDLKADNVSVPISVDYSSNGTKVNTIASSTGLGWNLTAGGVITREPRGLPDEKDGYWNTTFTVGTNSTSPFSMSLGGKKKGFIKNSTGNNLFEKDIKDYTQDELKSAYFDENDGESDVFHFNFLGKKGRFYLSADGTPQIIDTKDIFITYELNDVSILKQFVAPWGYSFINDLNNELAARSFITKFVLTDSDGTKYFFETLEGSTTGIYGVDLLDGDLPSNFDECSPPIFHPVDIEKSPDLIPYKGVNYHFPGGGGIAVNAWHLTKIIPVVKPTAEISFEYKNEWHDNMSNFAQEKTYNSNGNEVIKTRSIRNIVLKKRLSKIKSEYETIEVIANTIRNDLATDGYTKYDIDPSGKNNELYIFEKPKLIDEIKILNSTGLPLKSFKFSYGAFAKTTLTCNANKPWFQAHRERPKLLSVEEIGSDGVIKGLKNSFIYDETPLPPRTSSSKDYWGYYNGKVNTNLIPTIYGHPDNLSNAKFRSMYSLWQRDFLVTSNFSLDGVNREPDENFSKAGILTKVNYSTGGSEEFEYEGNNFGFNGANISMNGAFDYKGPGLRIKKVTKKDLLGSSISTNYQYSSSGSERSSGRLTIIPIFAAVAQKGTNGITYSLPANGHKKYTRIFSDAQNSIDKSYVLYSQVKVSQTGNGYSIYKIDIPYTQSEYDYSKSYFTNLNYSFPTQQNPDWCKPYEHEYFPHAMLLNVDWLQGQVSEISNFDENNRLLQKTSNTYRLRDIKEIKCKNIFVDTILSGASIGTITKRFLTSSYKQIYGFKYLSNTKTEDFFYLTNGQLLGSVDSEVEFVYGNNHTNPTIITKKNSDGKVIKTFYKYAFDDNTILPGISTNHVLAINNLLRPLYINSLLETKFYGNYDITKTLANNLFTKWNVSEYTYSSTFNYSNLLPKFIKSSTNNNNLELDYEFEEYGTNGKLTKGHSAGMPLSTDNYIYTNGLLTSYNFLGFKYNYIYNSNRLLEKTINPDGQYTMYSYDFLNRLKTSQSRYDAGVPNIVTNYTYSYGFLNGNPNNFVNTKTTFGTGSSIITQEARAYFDGLGRNLQNVKAKYNPENNNNDVVFGKTDYDAIGRVSRSMLPIAVGYSNTLAYTNGVNSWQETKYEPSPLNRVSQVISPNGYKTTMTYGSNVKIAGSIENVKKFLPSGAQNGEYDANSLYKETVSDPNASVDAKNGTITTTFKDKLGRAVLVRKKLTDAANLDTYYIYDDIGNLVFVLPPDAANGTSPLAFSYTYNKRNLLIKKYVPNAGITEYWYDARNLQVAMRDANMAKANKYFVTEYDAYGRVVKTGYSTIASFTPAVISIAPPLSYAAADNMIIAPLVPAADLQTENTYDDVLTNPVKITFGKITKTKTKVLLPSTTTVNTNPSFTIPNIATAPSASVYIESEFNYDAVGRVVSTKTKNQFGRTEISTNNYKNLGLDWLIANIYGHTALAGSTVFNITNGQTHDNWGRSISANHTTPWKNTNIAKNNFNYRDQLLSKQLNYIPPTTFGTSPSTWQQIDYQYNTDGFLTKINDPWSLAAPTIGFVDCPSDPGCVNCNATNAASGAAAAIRNIEVTVRYNSEALNNSTPTSGKIAMRSTFQIVDNEGKVRKESEEKTLNIGEVDSKETQEYDAILTVKLDQLGTLNTESSPDLTSKFNLRLTEELNATKLNENARIAVENTVAAAFAVQAQAATATLATATGGYIGEDLFHQQLYYDDTAPTGSSGKGAVKQYNGNISQTVWRVGDRQRQAYIYNYDRIDRLTQSKYFDIPTTGIYGGYDKFGETFAYDNRGNIKSKRTNGAVYDNVKACYTSNAIDNLVYKYDDTNSPNKLLRVTDLASSAIKSRGFNQNNIASTAIAFQYDDNGNLKKDDYKSLTFEYNYLNLPSRITKSPTQYIELYYTASGQKLRKVVVDGATRTFTDYMNGLEYINGNLDAVYHSEGRLKKLSATSYRHEYALKDHLGNARIYFTDADNNGQINKNDIIQESHYYAFGMAYDNYPWGGTATPNKYQYNGKELNTDIGLNLSDYGARWYDAALGRWHSPDPLAEIDPGYSPYNYVMNNPLKFVDYFGMFGGPPDEVKKGGNLAEVVVTATRTKSTSSGGFYSSLWSQYDNQSGQNPYTFTRAQNEKIAAGITTALTAGVAAEAGAVGYGASKIPELGMLARNEMMATGREIARNFTNRELWLSKAGLNLVSQGTASAIKGEASFDFADLGADLVLTPFTGALFSSQIDIGFTETKFGNTSMEAISATVFGFASNRTEGVIGSMLSQSSIGLNNLSNFIGQISQKLYFTIGYEIPLKGTENLKNK